MKCFPSKHCCMAAALTAVTWLTAVGDPAHAQSTFRPQWSPNPSRSAPAVRDVPPTIVQTGAIAPATTRPSRAVVPAGGASFVPDWQRPPRRAPSVAARQAAYYEPTTAPAPAPAPTRTLTPTPVPVDTIPAPAERVPAGAGVGSGDVFEGWDGQHGDVVEGGVYYEDGTPYQEGPVFGEQFDGACESCGPGGVAHGLPGHACCPDCCEPADPYEPYGFKAYAAGLSPAVHCGDIRYLLMPLLAFKDRRLLLDETSVFVGTHGFKGPVDMGVNGNFGFNEGINAAGALIPFYGIGYQVGGRFTQSNLSGDSNGGVGVQGLGNSGRDQAFITAGVFHRAFCDAGLQWGVVVDILDDDYYENFSVTQLRTELSYLFCCGHEFGFWGAFNTKSDTEQIQFANNQLPFHAEIESTDIYTLFYRYNTCLGGQARIWAGGTNNRDGILGSDFRVPLNNQLDFVGGVNYLIPNEGELPVQNNVLVQSGSIEESWGLYMNLVWYPGRWCGSGCDQRKYRAMFQVADPSVMMLDVSERN